jgi:outer membrane receptor protein involved in Fe transport
MGVALAQQAPPADEQSETIVVTGTRITTPGIESSSQITSVGTEEIILQQTSEAEKIIRTLPMTVPGDGANANNGTAGAATVNLRALGPERNLVMMNGARITPFDFDGKVDTQVVPTALIDRIDIITGGASTVYGSDAMSGVINFILKRDFEGAEFNVERSITGEDDGETVSIAATLGANIDGGRGNAVLSLIYSDRDGVQGGQRPLGQLGIGSADGAGYSDFLAGRAPTAPTDPLCQGENAVQAGGSGVTTPTRVAIFGGIPLGQVRTDNTIAANCSVFNFNPYNYYQTPQERFGATAIAHYTINENFEPYAQASFSATNVTQQVAPSGIFTSPFWTPLANPFISAQQRAFIIGAAETARTAGTPLLLADGTLDTDGNNVGNWRDLDGSGTVTAADDLQLVYQRRTTEFGPRSTTFDTNWFQIQTGMRGQITDSWDYDISIAHGQSVQTQISAGYTNLANLVNAINAVDPNVCRTGGGACVPINLWGAPGGITPAMVGYSSASAVEKRKYEQTIVQAIATGSIEAAKTPWSSTPLGLSVGMEYREEFGGTTPDECIKLAPTSCLGGNGGYTLPISGGFSAYEYFAEAIMPLIEDQPFVKDLQLELGYRYADYDPSGGTDSWKYGLSWKPVDQLRIRAMQQRAVRAPNVGELASPQVITLDNAFRDPCSAGNPNPIVGDLLARCLSTGMSAGQVGVVGDLEAGQINVFTGTDLSAPVTPEIADTTTFGFVWTPEFDFGGLIKTPQLTLDYYHITIDNYIEGPPAQDVLDACYVFGDATQCGHIRRVGGSLVVDGSGVETFTQNLDFLEAEGLELGVNFEVELPLGSLDVSFNGNHYLKNEFHSFVVLPTVECSGLYSASCGGNFGTPLPETRWIQRTTWNVELLDRDWQFSYLWRHLGEATSGYEVDNNPETVVFPAFATIPEFDYIDLAGNVQLTDGVRLSFGVTNVFEEDPPVVGNEAADTTNNSLNTFPSTYDPLGRVFSIGLNAKF